MRKGFTVFRGDAKVRLDPNQDWARVPLHLWYWEPLDHQGQTAFVDGYDTLAQAMAAAEVWLRSQIEDELDFLQAVTEAEDEMPVDDIDEDDSNWRPGW